MQRKKKENTFLYSSAIRLCYKITRKFSMPLRSAFFYDRFIVLLEYDY